MEETEKKVCPKCNADLPKSATFCPECGTALEEPKNKKCPECGKMTPANSKFCIKCGHSMAPTQAESTEPKLKICKVCSSRIKQSAIICPVCKQMADVAPNNDTMTSSASTSATPTASQNPTGGNGFAITGFVLSFFVPLLGLIFSVLGKGKAKDNTGRGLAIAGMVISIVTMAINIIISIYNYSVYGYILL